jgi:DNA-binding NarL/FixJ family response regulator
MQMADDIQIVGEATTGKQVLSFLETNAADVVLMDIDMPEGNGIEITQQLKRLFPEVKVIMLTMADNEKFVKESVEAGANGYVLKTAGGKQLLHAIRVVAEGEEYFSAELTKLLLYKEDSIHKEAFPGVATGQMQPLSSPLSKKEMEVLQLVTQGYTNQEIADMTFTSKRTVESHRQNLLQKTGCNNTATLVRYAAKHGLLT